MCGIMGYSGPSQDKRNSDLELALFYEISVRGHHAAGYFADGVIRKDAIPSWAMALQRKTRRDFEGARVVMGHARYATDGNPANPANNHPFVAGDHDQFVLIHNGIIHTKPAGIRLSSQCDSEVLVRLIERAGSVPEAKDEIFSLVGTFAFLCWDGQHLWFLRNNGSPGCYIEHNRGIFVASTPEIMYRAADAVGQAIPKPVEFPAYSLFRIWN
jgi:glucosamine 6-phosphate synthetase-like amidotransferase/phosphosugar isomerase protein